MNAFCSFCFRLFLLAFWLGIYDEQTKHIEKTKQQKNIERKYTALMKIWIQELGIVKQNRESILYPKHL